MNRLYLWPGCHFIQSVICAIESLLDVDDLVAELAHVPLQLDQIAVVDGAVCVDVVPVRVQDPHDQVCPLFFHG